MDRTSGQPQVTLSLLRNIYFKNSSSGMDEKGKPEGESSTQDV
jgi:hypothetical protein